MYIVTGSSGFIGSAMIWYLNQLGIKDVVGVDIDEDDDRHPFFTPLQTHGYMPLRLLRKDIEEGRWYGQVKGVFHLGGISSTACRDTAKLLDLNVDCTKELILQCRRHRTPIVYASSASVYGRVPYFDDEGRHPRFYDLPAFTPRMQAPHEYGESKRVVDQWLYESGNQHAACGLRFFNVYGPNEELKDQPSMVRQTFLKLQNDEPVQLFGGIRPLPERDFIYVKDVVACMWKAANTPEMRGVFNLGTGVARSFSELVHDVAEAMGEKPRIAWVPLPERMLARYQIYTPVVERPPGEVLPAEVVAGGRDRRLRFQVPRPRVPLRGDPGR